MDSHRNPSMEKFMGKRVRIDMPTATYFGFLDYSDGWYVLNHAEYRSKDGEYRNIGEWKFRRTHIMVSKVHEIDQNAVISRG